MMATRLAVLAVLVGAGAVRGEGRPRRHHECGRVPLHAINTALPEGAALVPPLRCGDTNQELAGGGSPDERHLMGCALATPDKLSSYADPHALRHSGVQRMLVRFAREETDCDVATNEAGFVFVAKPSRRSALLKLAMACFDYESSMGASVQPRLLNVLRRVEAELGEDARGLVDEQEGWVVQMVFGMLLGYHRRATREYFVSSAAPAPTHVIYRRIYDACATAVLAHLRPHCDPPLLDALRLRTTSPRDTEYMDAEALLQEYLRRSKTPTLLYPAPAYSYDLFQAMTVEQMRDALRTTRAPARAPSPSSKWNLRLPWRIAYYGRPRASITAATAAINETLTLPVSSGSATTTTTTTTSKAFLNAAYPSRLLRTPGRPITTESLNHGLRDHNPNTQDSTDQQRHSNAAEPSPPAHHTTFTVALAIITQLLSLLLLLLRTTAPKHQPHSPIPQPSAPAPCPRRPPPCARHPSTPQQLAPHSSRPQAQHQHHRKQHQQPWHHQHHHSQPQRMGPAPVHHTKFLRHIPPPSPRHPPHNTTATTSTNSSIHDTPALTHPAFTPHRTHRPALAAQTESYDNDSNPYDMYCDSGVVPIQPLPLSEENVIERIQDVVHSRMGQTMFGCHARPKSIGVTGSIHFVDLDGPTVILGLEGEFWHRRQTVLRRVAVWLNACIPEISDVWVEDPEELNDFVEDDQGRVLDRRSPDFNGDREVMEYQGLSLTATCRPPCPLPIPARTPPSQFGFS